MCQSSRLHPIIETTLRVLSLLYVNLNIFANMYCYIRSAHWMVDLTYLQIVNDSLIVTIFLNYLRQGFQTIPKPKSCLEILNILSSLRWSINCMVIGKYFASYD